MTPHLWRIFGWQVVRDVWRHPLLALLNILSVALGIAVYLAIQIANQGANRSFAATVDLVAGKAQLEIRGEVNEALWPEVYSEPGVASATGIVEGVVTLPDFPGEYLRLLGVDLFSGEPFRTVPPGAGMRDWNLESWLGKPAVIALAEDFAREHGVKAGDHMRALVNGEIKTLTVLTLMDTADSPAASQQRFAMIDIGWAQELFRRQGKLSSIQILLEKPDGADAVASRLNSRLPADLHAAAPRQRGSQLQHMVSAFQLNLTALSMVSLLVGVFLIYNTISAAVTRRRREIGILRAIGATRTEVRALFLGEALLFGTAGVLLGCVAGIGLAQTLSAAVARTITSLYVLTSIDRATPSAVELLTAALFGSLAVLAGAWLPATEASRIDPVAVLSFGPNIERSAASAVRLGGLAGGCLAVGALAVGVCMYGGPPLTGFIAALCVLASAALLSPAVIRAFGRAASAGAPGMAVIWRLAADGLRRSVHRNAMTVAALSTAIAMLTGLTVMIFSFRQSVSAWIDRGIVADLFIAPASNEQIGIGATVPLAAITWLESRPEVAAVDTIREQSVSVTTPGRSVREPAALVVVRGAYRHNLDFQGGDSEAKASRVFTSSSVAVTESFARRFKAREGDQVTVLSPRGPVVFPIAGVYSDYSRDQGAILIDRKTFDHFWDESGVHSLAVFLVSGAASERLSAAFREQFSGAGEFSVYSNRSLRARILAVFDQTFAVTSILRTVAVIVAITGVYLSVVTLVTEREREIGILRAVGASRFQIHELLITEASMIGLISSGLGLAAGSALALLLTAVVNPAFFGWTVSLHVPWQALVATPLWVVIAAALAAWHPSWRATRSNIAAALREE